ncbi:MAG: Unknown protein [uncultured Aureispira sp.]|uniref:Uncharacterized protein n=1 Tax=uncultured Aureispira sp. TaxID=1331704 RepID=A0A6S6SKS0_9BACT|nr:MAG: Unknown protein [uncultured Aureispira sp.]
MRHLSILSFLLFSFLVSCSTSTTEETNGPNTESKENITEATSPKKHSNENVFVASVEEAHQRAAFLTKKAIQFDILLSFGGKERLNGTILVTTDSRQAVTTYKNGEKLYYNEDNVYHAPTMENAKRARFNAYTWPYFALFPYKLSDPGTNWSAYEQTSLNEKEYLSQKLSFDAGTGDDPGDWYIVYADKETHLIDVAAYIVTAGKTQAEAEEDPHAIQYKDYTMVDGIPIPQRWIFWEWRKEGGLTKELGSAAISNIKFVEADEKTFVAPDNFTEL